MSELIQELLPYVKGFTGLYLIGNVMAWIFSIVFIIFVFSLIIKKRSTKFDFKIKNYKSSIKIKKDDRKDNR